MDKVLQTDRISRVDRLDAWLRSQGVTFKDIAMQYGCHWTYPGKMLRAEVVEMPKKFRRFMLDVIGCPEELLPPPGDKKKGTTRNQQVYAAMKEAQKSKAISELMAERANRPRSDISLTVGV